MARPPERPSVAHEVERYACRQLPVSRCSTCGPLLDPARHDRSIPKAFDQGGLIRVSMSPPGVYNRRFPARGRLAGLPRPLILRSIVKRSVGSRIAVENREAIEGKRFPRLALPPCDD